MKPRSVTHASFVLERRYDASPARVFQAFADPKAKARWFSGPADWDSHPGEFDFRVGGRETSIGGPKGGWVSTFTGVYQDIVPDERIVYTYDMLLDGNRISVSLTTIELTPDGSGTRLKLTEQGAFLDGWDKPDLREHGTAEALDLLGASLARAEAA